MSMLTGAVQQQASSRVCIRSVWRSRAAWHNAKFCEKRLAHSYIVDEPIFPNSAFAELLYSALPTWWVLYFGVFSNCNAERSLDL